MNTSSSGSADWRHARVIGSYGRHALPLDEVFILL
jgi:hypothetical protein